MRAFVFGVLLVACSGGAGEQVTALASAGSSGEASAPADVGGLGGAAADAAGAASVAGQSSKAGAPSVAGEGSGGRAGAASVVAGGGSAGSPTPAGGASGAGSGGAGGAPSAVSGAGGVNAGGSAGSAGSVSDPLAPFPAPGCPGFTAYRVPRGHFLAVTSGNFETNSIKKGACTPLQGDPTYQRCGTFSNVDQCVCTVSSPPTCGQYCDGEYTLAVVRAEPGDTLLIRLHEGNGACVAGVPTKIDG